MSNSIEYPSISAYTHAYRYFFICRSKRINPKCQLRKFENKRVNGKNVQINTQHDVAMSFSFSTPLLFANEKWAYVCCAVLCCAYLLFGFKGSRFQSTLNRKTKNQPADEAWNGGIAKQDDRISFSGGGDDDDDNNVQTTNFLMKKKN